jgi:hypothetical protein
MKLPKELQEIKGKHRLRNFRICNMWLDGFDEKEIVISLSNSSHPVKLSRVYQILSDNKDYTSPRVAWSKAKRIHRRQQIAERVRGTDSRKTDETAALDGLMKEIEGDKATGAVIQNYIIIRNPEALKEELECKSVIRCQPAL